MALAVTAETLADWIERLSRAGATAAAGHQSVIRGVIGEMREAAGIVDAGPGLPVEPEDTGSHEPVAPEDVQE